MVDSEDCNVRCTESARRDVPAQQRHLARAPSVCGLSSRPPATHLSHVGRGGGLGGGPGGHRLAALPRG